MVRRRRYCDWKTREAAEVSKRTSSLRLTRKLKGDAVYSNLRCELEGDEVPEGRGRTDSGTW